MKQYDYLIVGSGLFGSTFACMAKRQGKKCLVIDKRPQLGGNLYCENIEGINVHQYGAHIFHTSNKEVWDFVNSIVEFNRYTNSPVANYKGKSIIAKLHSEGVKTVYIEASGESRSPPATSRPTARWRCSTRSCTSPPWVPTPASTWS